jgi:Tfp pilus assembly protein PilF
MSGISDKLEAMLASGRDEPILRYTLAKNYFESGETARALEHAKVAVELDADYSAAWRLLGQIQAAAGQGEAAATTFEHGIGVAERRGDQQAVREMRVFLRRLRKQ